MPETPLTGYNADFAASSTAALPLFNKSAGYNAPNTPGAGYTESELDYDGKTFYTDEYGGRGAMRSTTHLDEERGSIAPSGYTSSRPMFDARGISTEKDFRDAGPENVETVEEIRNSPARNRWVAMTWLCTWWIPSFMLRWCGGMKRPDVRMAWREKLLIKYVVGPARGTVLRAGPNTDLLYLLHSMIIWFICGCAVFVIVILGNLIVRWLEHASVRRPLTLHPF